MDTKYEDILTAARGRYRKVRVERDIPDTAYLNGYVLDMSDELLMIAAFHDFHPEGATIVRMRDIASVRSNEYERKWDSMLAAEGLLDAVGTSFQPKLDDMPTLLEDLRVHRRPLITEAEDLSDDDDGWSFLIGYIDRIDEEACWLRHFDGLGRWKKLPAGMALEDITAVQIETPYIETFLRHVPPLENT